MTISQLLLLFSPNEGQQMPCQTSGQPEQGGPAPRFLNAKLPSDRLSYADLRVKCKAEYAFLTLHWRKQVCWRQGTYFLAAKTREINWRRWMASGSDSLLHTCHQHSVASLGSWWSAMGNILLFGFPFVKFDRIFIFFLLLTCHSFVLAKTLDQQFSKFGSDSPRWEWGGHDKVKTSFIIRHYLAFHSHSLTGVQWSFQGLGASKMASSVWHWWPFVLKFSDIVKIDQCNTYKHKLFGASIILECKGISRPTSLGTCVLDISIERQSLQSVLVLVIQQVFIEHMLYARHWLC